MNLKILCSFNQRTANRRNPETISKDEILDLLVPLRVWPNYRLIESPYYEFTITSTSNDKPPLYPDVQVMNSFRMSRENLSAVMIYPFARTGYIEEQPIIIEPEDNQILSQMQLAQLGPDVLYRDASSIMGAIVTHPDRPLGTETLQYRTRLTSR